jgi:hypothetical protein
VLTRRATENVIEYWGFITGCVGSRVHPALLAGWYTSAFRHEGAQPLLIDFSVGSFASPNPQEAKAVRNLLDLLRQGSIKDTGEFPVPLERDPHAPPPRVISRQRRPLLIVTGQEQATRRFLRDLARSAPDRARRFVVATGDAVEFNTIYRDRLVTWPIQDLPFRTVFFSHRNPIDTDAGFIPIPVKEADRSTDEKLFPPRLDEPKPEALPGTGPADRDRAVTEGPRGTLPRSFPRPAVQSSSGTEDLLLFRDIVEALALAFGEKARSGRASDLAQGLLAVHLLDGKLIIQPRGKPLFRPDGQRTSGTGEHVIYLRPLFQGARVLPRAVIEVWSRQPSEDLTNVWIRYREPLTVSYDEF